MKKVEIFTDGACNGNPGPGGWAAILKYKNYVKKISGFVKDTTNSRMELFALISALNLLNQGCDVNVFSDSKYVVDSISNGWVLKWKKEGWKRKNREVPNADLWDMLLNIVKPHKINMNLVKGHSGHPENEECDRMAVGEVKKNKRIGAR